MRGAWWGWGGGLGGGLAVVCPGPSQVMEVMEWFIETGPSYGLHPCRIKNKFALNADVQARPSRCFSMVLLDAPRWSFSMLLGDPSR